MKQEVRESHNYEGYKTKSVSIVDKSETSVSLCTVAPSLSSILFEGRGGGGYCTRSIPVLRPKQLKHHTLWGDIYLSG